VTVDKLCFVWMQDAGFSAVFYYRLVNDERTNHGSRTSDTSDDKSNHSHSTSEVDFCSLLVT